MTATKTRTRTLIAASASEDERRRPAPTPIASPAPRATDRPKPSSTIMAPASGRASGFGGGAPPPPWPPPPPAAATAAAAAAAARRPSGGFVGCGFGAHGSEERAAPAGPLPEVRRPRVVRAGDADAAPGPRPASSRTSTSQAAGPSSALTGSTRQPPHDRGVEQARRVDRARAARLGAVDEPLRHRVAGPRPGRAAGPRVDRRLDDALRRGGTSRSAASAVRSRTNARQSGAAAVSEIAGFARARVRVVAVAHPDPDGDRRRLRIRRRREVAVRREVAGVVRRAGLDGGRPVLAVRPVAELEGLRPDRVLAAGPCCPGGCR